MSKALAREAGDGWVPMLRGAEGVETCSRTLMSKEQFSLEGPHLLRHGLAETRSDWATNGQSVPPWEATTRASLLGKKLQDP